MPYVNNVVLSGGILQKILTSGKGDRGDDYFLMEYVLGKLKYPALVFDKRGRMVAFKPFPATIYGALTMWEGTVIVKVNSLIDNSRVEQVEP